MSTVVAAFAFATFAFFHCFGCFFSFDARFFFRFFGQAFFFSGGSLVLIADPRGGNLLNFNVGEALFALMPRTYWVELQTRFGNQYYVRDHGEDGAITDALDAVAICLEMDEKILGALKKHGCDAVVEADPKEPVRK